MYQSLETLLLKACKEENYEDELTATCAFYKDDFVVHLLQAQLHTFGMHFRQSEQAEVTYLT